MANQLPPRVLVVEDEAIVALDIQGKLQARGYVVTGIASTGREALELAATNPPDLALLDIMLKGDMDGIELALQLRARHDIPAIFLTAYGDDEILARAKPAEPSGYLLKPFNERELVMAIELAHHQSLLRSQRRQIESLDRQGAKLDAVARLASGVAHHFNNILAIIQGYADVLKSRFPDEQAAVEPAEAIDQAARRGASLVGQLLTFSQQQLFVPMAVDLADVARDLERPLREIIGRGVDIVVTGRLMPAPAKVDPNQIHRVLEVLVRNASDAMPGGGRVDFETGTADVRPPCDPSHPGIEPGSYSVLTVKDSGPGIAPAALARLFEPFFTTKQNSLGSGLGLAIAYGIVAQSGGRITASNPPGGGAIFKVYLPRD